MDERRKIARFVGLELAGEGIGEQDSLWDTGAIDSLGLLRLVHYLEKEFGFRIPEKDINLTVFRSIDSLARYVSRRQGKR